jgi:hypothetical protein
MDDLSSPMVASRDSGREAGNRELIATGLLGEHPFTQMSMQRGSNREARENPSWGSRGKDKPLFSLEFPLPLVHFLLNLRCLSSIR